jgi:hypothetical protein
VPGAYKEEDGRQQTKTEPGDRYKKNRQEALDPSINGLTASTNSEIAALNQPPALLGLASHPLW